MRCIVCDSNDWENVDKFRLKPAGMEMCKKCGFVSYPSKWATEAEIKAHYRKSYRAAPTAVNFFTGQRKLHYHNAFLQPVFQAWEKAGLTNPAIFEVGAAYGMFLAFMRDKFPGADVSGTEWATAYRRNAYHEFGINLFEDFDTSKQYDLIASYKVAEHQLDVDQQIALYAKHLKPGGLLYISVPTWFDSMSCFGIQGFDLGYYYDPNHINVWTRSMFELILEKAGFEILSENHVMYDSTYLCRVKQAGAPAKEITLEGPDNIKLRLAQIQSAAKLAAAGDFEGAIRLFPNFPSAWVNWFEGNRKPFFDLGWEWIEENVISKAMKACPEKIDVLVMVVDLHMRANKFKEALPFIEQSLTIAPENVMSLHQLVNCMRELGLRATDPKEKIAAFEEGRKAAQHLKQVSAQHFKESLDLCYMFNSHIPCPSEN